MKERKRIDLYDAINSALSMDSSALVICIAGASCSGKSTLARNIKDNFTSNNPCIICQDDWFKNIEDIPKDDNGYYNFETEDAFHKEEFLNDVTSLIANGSMNKPKYNIQTNQRVDKIEVVQKSPLIILEGLHTILWIDEILGKCEIDDRVNLIKVWVDSDKNICSIRRAERDIKFINRDMNFLMNHYNNVIYLHYEDYISLQLSLLSKYDFYIKEVI